MFSRKDVHVARKHNKCDLFQGMSNVEISGKVTGRREVVI